MIDFLAAKRAYPMFSRKGNIFFRKPANTLLSDEKAKEIIDQLKLKTGEDCRRIREIVKERLDQERTNRPIREWIKEERPREMLHRYGPSRLSLSKLLAIILRTGREGMSAEELGRSILNRFKTLRGIDSSPLSELCSIQGVGEAKAAQIKAALELGKRLYRERAERKRKISSAVDVITYVSEYYAPYLRDSTKEFFNIILLDSRNKPIDNIEISKGSITASVVDPKEIIREATMKSASAIILIHNHPSGEPDPSQDDIHITDQIVRACNLVGIKVLDHVIIGKDTDDYVSLLEKGLIR
ncbi:MAG: DNA repair protein RadC [Deltaproteobacteria bacterium]|nr:MAG: DNA repair protein RadC [Deltaproteobacteria bacterium]